MAHGAAANKRLGNLVHLDGRLHARIDSLLLECVLQRERVDHGCQHAHMVSGNTVHLFGLLGHAAEKIPPTYDDCDLHAERMNVGKLCSDLVNARGIHAKALIGSKGLAGEFEEDAFENRFRHRHRDIIAN